MIKVQKRDGEIQPFDQEKIKNAVLKAMKDMEEVDEESAEKVAKKATGKVRAYLKESSVETDIIAVDIVHKMVENSIMDVKLYDVAREYITYRKEHAPDIFRERVAYKPYEYPQLASYVDAIQQSYWIHSEFNYTQDIQDFKTTLEPHEKEAIRRCMLAISQVEVAVKKFWSRIGDRMPKPEIEEVGSCFADSECYDDQTQVLTNEGWKYFSELTKTEKVAQYNQLTGKITFAKPISYLTKKYSGVMHHYQGRGTDICVTPNHEILVMHPAKEFYEKRESSSGVWGRNYRYPSAGYSVGGAVMDNTTRLLVAIQADGCLMGETPSGRGRRDFSFLLYKERKISRLKSILENLGVDYYERVRDSSGGTVISARLPESVGSTEDIKNFDFVDLENIGTDFCKDFVDEISFWDSHVSGENVLYYNTNEKAVDKLQAIATLGGMSANKSINRTAQQSMLNVNPDGNDRKSAKDCFVLSITNVDKKVYPRRKEIDYDGNVYCVTVPDGNIVTRRNKRVAIQGNCRHSRAYSHLLEILGLNSDFESVLEVPAIKKRVEYAQKALAKGKTESNKDYMESVLLFTLFIENVSLFSQFLVISQMNKDRGVIKGMANVVGATSLEEQIHAQFGSEVVNILREENPDWFTEELNEGLIKLVNEAFEAEVAIIEWIFEEGEFAYLTRDEVVEYIKKRFNKGLQDSGFSPAFDIDKTLLSRVEWFDVQNNSTSHTDFFSQRSINYTKFDTSFDEDSLF